MKETRLASFRQSVHSLKTPKLISKLPVKIERENPNKTLENNVYFKCFVHELRDPLSSILLGTQLLEEEYNDVLLVEGNETTSELYKDIFNCLEFIQNILTKFSFIQDFNVKLNKFELFSFKDTFKKIKSYLPKTLNYHNVEFELIYDDQLCNMYIGDQFNLTHVIVNLLKNAIKYQNPDFKNKIIIRVSKNTSPDFITQMSVDQTAPLVVGLQASLVSDLVVEKKIRIDEIIITVEDNNCHILPHIKDNLFTTFNSTSGSGLGLYICKTIIELHGGSINHEFIEPNGNKFIIYLKLQTTDFEEYDIFP